MSAAEAVIWAILIVSALIAVAIVAENAPKIIRARADARLLAERAGAEYTLDDVSLALVAAIQRTDPELPLELAERIAAGVLEDLHAGVIHELAQEHTR